MTAADELLAAARLAADRFAKAPIGSDEESEAGKYLLSAFRGIDEQMLAGGPPPAEWAPPIGWNVVIPFPTSEYAESGHARVLYEYSFGCSVVEQDGTWEVIVPFQARESADELAIELRGSCGYAASVRAMRR